MKKVLLFIILNLSIFMLAGCGSDKKTEEKENTSTEVKETEKDETPVEVEESQKEDEPEEVKEIEKIKTCPDCVFFYNSNLNTIPFEGEKRKELTNYTDDYTSLKRNNGEKALVFLGGVLDSEGKLIKAYVCGNKDGYYCLQASTDGSTYKKNVKTLKKVFGAENCKTTTPSGKPKQFECSVENTGAVSDVNGGIRIGVYSPSQGCFGIAEEGYINCYSKE